MPPEPEARDHPIAAIDDRLRVVIPIRLSITALATGAANVAPSPGTAFELTATATLGSLAGANTMNHTLFIRVPKLRLGGAGLARDRDAGNLSRGAGAFLATASIIVVKRSRSRGFHRITHCTRGGESLARGPLFGVHQLAPSVRAPSACWPCDRPSATSAICSGVTSSLSWPMPRRPTSTCGLRGRRCVRHRLPRCWSTSLQRGKSSRGL